jgi:hypothetical protein
MEVLLDIVCLCSLAKSKTTIVLADEIRLRTLHYAVQHPSRQASSN